ncbi:phage baseplate assembly protein V [Burkholderia cenocepacia]|uniref:Phage baseplate assembly protein n=1 Tax=Burkholderia cenocepacia TaxID=95486 RepID=A0A6B2MQ64_9BURK|nr:phage baseplate assembly protein V [Burkholderia cenocepacia]NDV77089.1 phage baseplate assembly protein [Burkholderia cenocepacia]
MSDRENGVTARIARFITVVTGWGRVTHQNDSGGAQLLQVQVNERETIDNLPRSAEFGLTSVPPNGSDVTMLNLGGGRNNAVIVGTNHQQSRPRNLQPGETMLYSQDGKSVYLTASGGVVVEAKGQAVTVNDASIVTINAATKVRMVTPRFECTGDIVDNCDTTGRSMAADRVIFDEHEHNVRNVQGGGSTITSDPPNQTE